MSENIYTWNLTKREGKFWEYFMWSIKLEEINKHNNGKWYARIKVQLRKEPGKYWETHNILIDTWKPEEKKEQLEIPASIWKEWTDSKVNIEDVPF